MSTKQPIIEKITTNLIKQNILSIDITAVNGNLSSN